MKIILEKSKCIGCGSCVSLCESFFEIKEDGKAHLKNSKNKGKDGNEELEIKKASCAKEAAEVCPVECIKIKNEK